MRNKKDIKSKDDVKITKYVTPQVLIYGNVDCLMASVGDKWEDEDYFDTPFND